MKLFMLCILLCLSSHVYAGIETEKFRHWFPLLSKHAYEQTSTELCNSTLTRYRQSLTGHNHTYQAATCSVQQRCILDNLREDIKSRMASASVLLGLLPGLLASIAPSISEIAVLSEQNPILSILISLGCSAVYPSRLLEYDDPLHLLTPKDFRPMPSFDIQNPALAVPATISKYVVLVIAIINVLYTSWDLGTRTVVSFMCVNYNLPLIWTSLSLIIHVFACGGYYKRILSSRIRRNRLPGVGVIASKGPSTSDLKVQLKPTNSRVFLYYTATICGFLHVIFGIVVFSSLLFIELVDVVTVALRYIASTLVARIILVHELDRIRRQQ